MKKSIIRIFSPARAGSTLLGLMLDNSTNTICPGELEGLFTKHNNEWCWCEFTNPNKPEKCNLWHKVYKKGKDKVYTTLHESGFSIIIDTMKLMRWYKELNYPSQIKDIIVYKEIEQQFYSYWKRKDVIKNYGLQIEEVIERYKDTFNLSHHPIVVKYSDLAQKPEKTIKTIISNLSIKGYHYQEEQEKFWNNNHHVYAGSDSALMHLVDKDTTVFQQKVKEKNFKEQPGFKQHYREIYYDDKKLPEKFLKKLNNQKLIEVYNRLENMRIDINGN